jgi:hypothetical protein
MSVSCECCVLSGTGLCYGLVPRPEESYRVWCVSNVCDRESINEARLGPQGAVESLGGGGALAIYATKLAFRITHYTTNYEITIPWPSFQAIPSFQCDFFSFTPLLPKGQGSEACNPSNNVMSETLYSGSGGGGPRP